MALKYNKNIRGFVFKVVGGGAGEESESFRLIFRIAYPGHDNNKEKENETKANRTRELIYTL